MNTRSKTKDLIRTSHRQSSELHRAISSRDKKTLAKLLENGDAYPCVGEGINCFYLAKTFCSYDYVKLLLQYEPKGVECKNMHGVTLLMNYAQNAIALQDLIKSGANPNEKSKDGQTALMHSVKNKTKNKDLLSTNIIVEAIDVLLKNGANINETDNLGQTVLMHSAQNFDYFSVKVISFLIEKGADPLISDNKNLTVLSHAMRNFVENFEPIRDKLSVFDALAYLSSLSKFDGYTFKCKPILHPQSLLLEKLLYLNSVSSDIPVDLFGLLLNSKYLDPNLIVNVRSPLDLQNQIALGPLALFLNTNSLPSRVIRCSVKTCLKKLLCCGFKFSTKDSSISPVTIVLCNEKISRNYARESIESLIKFLIKYGAPVEQRQLIFSADDDILRSISNLMCVPDAVRIAASKGLTNVLKMFVPYFAHPPVALLCFAEHSTVSLEMVQTLSLWGPLTQSNFHKLIFTFIQRMNLPVDVLEYFEHVHHTPPKLKEICRYTIRTVVGPHAYHPGNSLPRLILNISPPGLREYLLMRIP